MKLSVLLHALVGVHVNGPDVEITDVAYDSRRVHPGTLFLAVPSVGGSSESGGYRRISEAVASGASAVLTQVPGVTSPVPVVTVPDARVAMSDIAAAFFRHPSREMRVFAVTGTDGKTTTCFLLDGIFSGAGLTTGLMGTVETRIAGERLYNADRMTTPEAPDVQHTLRRMADAGVTHCSMEASSHALALDRLRGTHFAATAFTNLTGDHVEFHGSFDAYCDAKRRLFAELAPDAPLVVNADDPHWEAVTAGHRGLVVTYGFGTSAHFRAEVQHADAEGSHFTLSGDGERGEFLVPIPGRFNVLNAAAACLLARAAGFSFDEIAPRLAHAEPPPGRLQDVGNGAPFRVLVDYAHTPHAFRSVLTEVRAQTPGRLIAVFGATGNRDVAKRPVLGAIAGELADFFVITNEDPFGEDADAIIDQVAAGAPAEAEGTRFVRIHDRGDAIRLALDRAQPGDTVVITGKGHEQSIVVGGRKEPWNDADVVRAALRARE
jgi:UDP-N-acetylmuramoyl-L-alanyl-D-glutamate--2,6-diaminopimelate ligase